MSSKPGVDLTTDEQRASYGFGLQFGDQLRRNSFDGLDLDAVLAGIQDWYHGREAALNDEQINASYRIIQDRRKAQEAEQAGKRRELADIFLEANAAREGTAKSDELSGSTLTVTSLGPLGGVATTPVINRPEVAIIGPNRIVERPMLVPDGMGGERIEKRKLMNISIS